jgi:DNA-binding NtrC family response regulator
VVKYLEGGRYEGEVTKTELARLLIVDDHKTTGCTLKAIFDREGYKVWYVPDAAKANALIGKNLFDAAILDLDLAGRSGLGLLRTLQQRQPQCKPVILTGHPSLESWEAAFQGGAIAYLVKPCDLNELTGIIREATDGAASSK